MTEVCVDREWGYTVTQLSNGPELTTLLLFDFRVGRGAFQNYPTSR